MSTSLKVYIGDAKIVVDKNVPPVQHSTRRVPLALQKDVKILELEEEGIIKKAVELSEWISSMVIVAKHQKIRICMDSKDLNRAVQCPKLQMPTLEELLPELSKAQIFSSFDTKDGFINLALMMRVTNSLLCGHPLEDSVTQECPLV